MRLKSYNIEVNRSLRWRSSFNGVYAERQETAPNNQRLLLQVCHVLPASATSHKVLAIRYVRGHPFLRVQLQE